MTKPPRSVRGGLYGLRLVALRVCQKKAQLEVIVPTGDILTIAKLMLFSDTFACYHIYISISIFRSTISFNRASINCHS